MKKDNVIADSVVRIAGEYFSFESANFDKYPIELQKLLLETEIRILRKKISATELEILVAKNPDIPEYKTLLLLIYDRQGRRSKSFEIALRAVREHPGYLACKLYLGLHYVLSDEIEKAYQLFNGFVELEELFPDRTEFLTSEVDDYLMMGILYYAAVEKIAPAAKRLEKLKARNPEYVLMEMAEKSIEAARRQRNVILFEEWRPKRRTVEYADRSLPQLTTVPIFELPEIEILYDRDFTITPEEISSLLTLPRDIFIRDLERMIMDARQRYQYLFYNEHDQEFPNPVSARFLSHAVLFLTECKAEASLPVILGLLEEDETFYFDWFEDCFEDCLIPAIYQLGHQQLDKLKRLMFEPNLTLYARDVVSDAVSGIAMHQPERRGEVLRWFEEVFQYFIDHREDERLIDTNLIGSMVISCTWIKAIELQEIIRTLFANDLVSIDFCGPFDDVKADLSGAIEDDDIIPMLTVYEQYEYFKSEIDGDDEPDIPDYPLYGDNHEKTSRSSFYEPQIPVIAEKTPGRNAPCPCGSGKKYKKCCM